MRVVLRTPALWCEPMRWLGLALPLALGVALGVVAEPAWAGNEAHPRTPVLWPPSACGQVIDRSVTPVVHIDYMIPAEDTALTPEELPDSRTHQFFALCRQRPKTELLPNWISDDDVGRSVLAGLIPADSVPTQDVLDTSADWVDCALRIDADDQRRPITFAAAEQGVDWEIAGVPVGVWEIAGYTFEPPFNLWRARPDFVKIVDDPSDPAQDLPAGQIHPTQTYWWPFEANELELCVDVLEPATAIVEWAPLEPELVWAELGSETIEADGLVTLAIYGPALEAPGGGNVQVEGLLRVRLIDALGREFVVHLDESIIFERCNGHCGDEPMPQDTGGTDDSQDSGESGGALDASSPACACSSTEPGRAWPLAWLLVIAALTRRRVPRPTRKSV